MTSTELTPIKKFEERVKDRLKDDIADLMPDEVLTSLIERSIQEMFFEDRTVKDGSYHTRTEKSWFNKAVETAIANRLEDGISRYISEHSTEINQKINEAVAAAVPQAIADLGFGLSELLNYLRSRPV